jgi:glucosylglycerate synthase
VLGALFLEAERTVSVWQKVRGSEAVPVVGADGPPSVEPGPVDQKRALDSFRLGQRNLQEIWSPVLPPLALLELGKLARLTDAAFRFPDALWARIVYDFALAYRMRVMNRDHLLSAFVPLYAGWLGSFIGEMEAATDLEVEARIEQLCLRYEAEKPYLISRWRWPDRFNP